MDGRWVATPLLLCLLVVESGAKLLRTARSEAHWKRLWIQPRFSDIVFATDSVPAVLGTTKAMKALHVVPEARISSNPTKAEDPFIAYTSSVAQRTGM